MMEQQLTDGVKFMTNPATIADVVLTHYAHAHVNKDSSPVHAAIHNTLLDETPQLKTLLQSL